MLHLGTARTALFLLGLRRGPPRRPGSSCGIRGTRDLERSTEENVGGHSGPAWSGCRLEFDEGPGAADPRAFARYAEVIDRLMAPEQGVPLLRQPRGAGGIAQAGRTAPWSNKPPLRRAAGGPERGGRPTDSRRRSSPVTRFRNPDFGMVSWERPWSRGPISYPRTRELRPESLPGHFSGARADGGRRAHLQLSRRWSTTST